MTTLSSPPFSPSADFPPSVDHSIRPRAVSALSSNSRRSGRSSSSGTKLDLTETHAEKRFLHTKADPTKALNEAQPGEPCKIPPAHKYDLLIIACQPPWPWKNRIWEICAKWCTKTLQETSSVRFRSIHLMFDPMILMRTPSADPDRANPTRPRLERPLETIMSFQRNIDYTDNTRRSPYSGPGR